MATELREWTDVFIEIYRSKPCVWKIKQIDQQILTNLTKSFCRQMLVFTRAS